MDIYKLLFTIVGFHLALSGVLLLMDIPKYLGTEGVPTQQGTQELVTEMTSTMTSTGMSTITNKDGSLIHDLCDPDDQNCQSDFETVNEDASIFDDIMRFIPGGKYITRFARFIKFVALAPYELILDRMPAAITNIVVLSLIRMLFVLWHFAIATNLFNWIFNNRGKIEG